MKGIIKFPSASISRWSLLRQISALVLDALRGNFSASTSKGLLDIGLIGDHMGMSAYRRT